MPKSSALCLHLECIFFRKILGFSTKIEPGINEKRDLVANKLETDEKLIKFGKIIEEICPKNQVSARPHIWTFEAVNQSEKSLEALNLATSLTHLKFVDFAFEIKCTSGVG